MIAEPLLARAAERTGLDDFGPDSYREGLDILLDSLTRAEIPEEPKAAAHEQMVVYLANRLRVVDYAARHPEVRDEVIARPLVVIGAPRSGTTLVSYLLDQDRDRRSLLLWEATDSIPPPTLETLRTDDRCRRLREAQEVEFRQQVVRPHVEFADGPTECLRVQGQEFKGLIWESRVPVPEYSLWLQDTDMTSAYEYERLVLQILQSTAPGTWSLKMPSHALYVEYLVRAFPDARIVWTHRDPYRALASVLKMKAQNWQRSFGRPALDLLLSCYPRQISEHLMRPLRLRERVGDAQFYDLHYDAVLADPIGEMRRLYEWAGDEFTPAAAAGMRGWLEANPQGRFGVHSYSLADFGLTRAGLEPLFGEYQATYEVEDEP